MCEHLKKISQHHNLMASYGEDIEHRKGCFDLKIKIRKTTTFLNLQDFFFIIVSNFSYFFPKKNSQHTKHILINNKYI